MNLVGGESGPGRGKDGLLELVGGKNGPGRREGWAWKQGRIDLEEQLWLESELEGLDQGS